MILSTPAQIVISLYQVVGNLGLVFDVPYPPMYRNVLSWLSIFDLNLFSFVPMACVMDVNFYYVLVTRSHARGSNM